VGRTKIAEKRAAVAAAGVTVPEDMDDETFVKLFGMGSTKPRPGKEMEAIRAANFLIDRDTGGAQWIAFNKTGEDGAGGAAGGRRGGRRRRG